MQVTLDAHNFTNDHPKVSNQQLLETPLQALGVALKYCHAPPIRPRLMALYKCALID